jgi:hypothetical protein
MVRLGDPIYILRMKHIQSEMWSCFLPSIIYLHKFTCFAAIWEKKKEGVSFPQVPVIVAGRSEHPFISICDLHDQLLSAYNSLNSNKA